jgi:hypothetical protein
MNDNGTVLFFTYEECETLTGFIGEWLADNANDDLLNVYNKIRGEL